MCTQTRGSGSMHPKEILRLMTSEAASYCYYSYQNALANFISGDYVALFLGSFFHFFACEFFTQNIEVEGEPGTDSGTLRHGSTFSRSAAVSAREYHLHIICILLTGMHVIYSHMFCIVP